MTTADLSWQPKGDQETTFADGLPKPVQDDILLVKMRPGQEIAAELHCEKGIGKDHAKYSPVGALVSLFGSLSCDLDSCLLIS